MPSLTVFLLFRTQKRQVKSLTKHKQELIKSIQPIKLYNMPNKNFDIGSLLEGDGISVTFSQCVSHKYSDLSKTLQEHCDRKYGVSFLDDTAIKISWKEGGWLAIFKGKTYAQLRMLKIHDNKLYLEVSSMEDPSSLLNDLARAFNNGTTDGTWNYATPKEMEESSDEDPVIGQDGSASPTPTQTLVAVHLGNISAIHDFLETNKLKKVYFDKEELKVELNSKGGADNDSFPTTFTAMLAGSKYEKEGNYEKAAMAYRVAAELGNPTAQNNLGWLYANGLGVERDQKEAYKWYSLAAEQDEIYALSNLGDFYANGVVVEEDQAKAVEYYTRAADKGLAMAQTRLGCAYFHGQGTKQDQEKAVQLFLKAAEQGDSDAQYILGICFHEGIGTAKDDQVGIKWYRKAAEAGNTNAQCNLGIMLFFGEGTEPNQQEAKEWFTKAARKGNKDAAERLQLLFGESDVENYIDLGLPSGTLWAEKDLGAKDISEHGTRRTGGEVADGLPSYEQASELIKQCEFYRGTYKGKTVWQVKGPNGNAIYFVEDDYSDFIWDIPTAVCWCNNGGKNQEHYPFIMISEHNITIGMTHRENKLPVRLVKNQSTS